MQAGRLRYLRTGPANSVAKSMVPSVNSLDGKRAMGFEPTTSSLGSWHSTAELRPQKNAIKRLIFDTFQNKNLNICHHFCHPWQKWYNWLQSNENYVKSRDFS